MHSPDKLLLRSSQSSSYNGMCSKITPSMHTSNRPSMTSLPRSQGSILFVQRRVGEYPGNEVKTSSAGAKTCGKAISLSLSLLTACYCTLYQPVLHKAIQWVHTAGYSSYLQTFANLAIRMSLYSLYHVYHVRKP